MSSSDPHLLGDSAPDEDLPGTNTFPSINGYEITGRLGEGGMGVVWAGIQASTKRPVAIKLLNQASFGSKRAKARFTREVELAASLHHPNIARVYASGLDQGGWYYAMELIEGVPLDRFVKERALDRTATLRLLRQVCLAMQHAHQRGVIHRDLKPSNILVTDDGEPHILDFGLAKDTSGESLQVSLQGDIAGTPAYMSPEQAGGNIKNLDTRTDVYSLGVILYLLLTGQPPHDLTGGSVTVLRRIAEEDVIPPRKAATGITGELEAILLKALARLPEERYASAGNLAADITNYLGGEPIAARPPTIRYFLRKKIAKHKGKTAITLGVLGLLALVTFWSYGQIGLAAAREWAAARRADQQRLAAEAAARVAQQQKEVAEQAILGEQEQRKIAEQQRQLALDQEKIAEQQKAEAQKQAALAQEQARLADSRKTEIEDRRKEAERQTYFAVVAKGLAQSMAGEDLDAHRSFDDAFERRQKLANDGINIPPESLQIALLQCEADHPSPVAIHDSAGKSTPATLMPDGRTAISYTIDYKSLLFWDIVTGAPVHEPLPLNEIASHATASKSGKFIALANRAGAVSLWSYPEGKKLWSAPAHKDAINGLAISADERWLGSAGADGTAKVFNLQTGKQVSTFGPTAEGSNATSIAFTPNGQYALTGVQDVAGAEKFGVCIWDPLNGKLVRRYPIPGQVKQLAVSSRGDFAAAADWFGNVRIDRLPSGEPLSAAQTGYSLAHVVFSSDDRLALAAGMDHRLTEVETRTGHITRRFLAAEEPLIAAGYFPHDTLAWSFGNNADRAFRVWNFAEPPALQRIALKNHLPHHIAASADGRLLAALSDPNHLGVWDQATGRLLSSLTAQRTTFDVFHFLEGDKKIALCREGGIGIWDLARQAEIVNIPGSNNRGARDLEISPNERFAAAFKNNGEIEVWDLKKGARAWTSPSETTRLKTVRMRFSPDSSKLLVGGAQNLDIFDAETGASVHSFPILKNGGVIPVDEHRALYHDTLNHFALYDLDAKKTLWTDTFTFDIGQLAISADNTRAFTLDADNTLRIWNLADGQLLGDLAHVGQSQDCRLAPGPDNHSLAILDGDSIGLWDFTRAGRQRDLAKRAQDAFAKFSAGSADPQATADLATWYAFRSVHPWAADLFEKARAGGVKISSLDLARAAWQSGDLPRARTEFTRAADAKEADDAYLRLCLAAIEHPLAEAETPARK